MKTLTVEQIQAIETSMLATVVKILNENEIPYYALFGTALGAVRHRGTIPWDSDVDLGIPYNFLTKALECLRQELSSEYVVVFHDTDKNYPYLFPRVGLAGVSHAHLHIDLFPLIGIPDDELQRKRMFSAFKIIHKIYPMKKHKSVWGRTPFQKKIKTILYRILQAVYPKSIATLEANYETLCNRVPFDAASYVFAVCPDESEQNIFPKEWLHESIRVPYHYVELTIPKNYEAYLTHIYGDYLKYPNKEEQEKGLGFTMEVPQHIFIPSLLA